MGNFGSLIYLCASLCNFVYEMTMLGVFVRLFNILSSEYFRVEQQKSDPSQIGKRRCCTRFYIFLLSAMFFTFSVLYSLVKPVLYYDIETFQFSNQTKQLLMKSLFYLQLLQVTQILLSSSLILYFMHYFGPYRSYQRMKKQIAEIIILTSQNTEGDDDTVLKRYRKLSTFSYSEYLLTSGREEALIQEDCFSEAYLEDEEEEIDREEFLENHLGIEATSSSAKRLSKQIRNLSSKRGSIGNMLESEISGAQNENSYQSKLQITLDQRIKKFRQMTLAKNKKTLLPSS